MRKFAVYFFLLIMTFICCQIGFAEDTNDNVWFMSDDGILKIRFVSFEEDNYPSYKLTCQFRLDGETLSNGWRVSYDLSSVVNSYVSINPSYSNRKVPIKVAEQFVMFQHLRGTMYNFLIPYSIGKDDDFSYALPSPIVDLALIYPDEFVNYDIVRAAYIIKEIKKLFFNPDSINLRSATLYIKDETPNIQYFSFEISGQVRAGGINTKEYVVRYDESTGGYIIYDIEDFDIVTTNYTNTGNLELEIIVEYGDFDKLYSSYNLSTSSIIQAVN